MHWEGHPMSRSVYKQNYLLCNCLRSHISDIGQSAETLPIHSHLMFSPAVLIINNRRKLTENCPTGIRHLSKMHKTTNNIPEYFESMYSIYNSYHLQLFVIIFIWISDTQFPIQSSHASQCWFYGSQQAPPMGLLYFSWRGSTSWKWPQLVQLSWPTSPYGSCVRRPELQVIIIYDNALSSK